MSLRNSSCRRGEKEIVEEGQQGTTPSPAVKKSTMFVALGKDVKDGEIVLTWALRHSRGMKICILHVHQPSQCIHMMGGKVASSLTDEHLVKAFHENEKEEMHKILDKYIQICDQAGVRAEKLWKEMDSIEKGIVELISEHGIKWLVMGSAANRSYVRKMKKPKSKKALHVRVEAPSFCHIWFICEGELIYTRESKLGGVIIEVRSDRLLVPSNGSGRLSTQSCCLNKEGNSDWGNLFRTSPLPGSNVSECSGEITGHSNFIPISTELNDNGPELLMCQQNDGDPSHSFVAASVIESNTNDEPHDRLEEFLAKAESSQKEAYEESIRRAKAEKDVINAIHRAEASETMYAEELRRRIEIEEALQKSREETKKMRWKLDEVLDILRVAQEQKFNMECQIADYDQMIEELEQKLFSIVQMLQKYKKEIDELQLERDNALREAEDLKEKQNEEAASSSLCQFLSEFSFLEIEEATSNFSQSLKIGEGSNGSVYRGNLRHTQVAVKMLRPNSLQGLFEFQQEVNILSKLRHPNIINLIGVCPEAWVLIYEYLPNGSLEDHLDCKDNTPPLSWKTRIRIAAELCSALIFLHSWRPRGIVHGDLKPSNVLLDANFVCKLTDFGKRHQLSHDELSENNTTLGCRTDPKRTEFTDPEFLARGDLTSKSDVYSFGIILLRLLTGRLASGLTKEVQYALDKGNFKDLLDPAAGDWPFVQAKQLAHLALSCSHTNHMSRPDLASGVWRVLEPMIASCGILSLPSSHEERPRIPSHFLCPIFQEIMHDPVVAADGFTYESEAFKGWLKSGHDNSPMSNFKLPHYDLLPNHALRSAIQEWLQTHRNYF